jgi:membrane protein YdbS with pleckstrin-like domain
VREIKPLPSLLSLWRGFAAVGALLPAFVTSVLFQPLSPAWLVATAVWLAVFFVIYLIYLPLLHRRLLYSVSDGRVTMRAGVFYHNIRSLPIAGIQYITVVRTPLDRLFRLYTVILAVAGGRMLLAGLGKEDADDLAALLGERP